MDDYTTEKVPIAITWKKSQFFVGAKTGF